MTADLDAIAIQVVDMTAPASPNIMIDAASIHCTRVWDTTPALAALEGDKKIETKQKLWTKVKAMLDERHEKPGRLLTKQEAKERIAAMKQTVDAAKTKQVFGRNTTTNRKWGYKQ